MNCLGCGNQKFTLIVPSVCVSSKVRLTKKPQKERQNMTTTINNNALETVKAAFDFSVDKFPLSGPDGMKTEWYGLFRSDNSQPVGNGSVTSRYTPHQTDDVIALVEASQEAFEGDVITKCHFRDGHFVIVEPTKEFRKSIFGTNDNIFPRLLINASYCGKAFNASMGYYRDVCRNMHIMRSVSKTCATIRHTSGLRSKMDELIQTFSVLRGSWAQLAETIEVMSNRETNMVEFLNAVYGEPESDTGRGATMHKNRTEAIFRRLMNERLVLQKGAMPADFKVTAWDAFNAVQCYVQHTATRKSDFNNEFDRMLLSVNDAAVQRAEELAMAA